MCFNFFFGCDSMKLFSSLDGSLNYPRFCFFPALFNGENCAARLGSNCVTIIIYRSNIMRTAYFVPGWLQHHSRRDFPDGGIEVSRSPMYTFSFLSSSRIHRSSIDFTSALKLQSFFIISNHFVTTIRQHNHLSPARWIFATVYQLIPMLSLR